MEVCDQIRETGFSIHKYHGPGHLEKIYHNALFNRLTKQGIPIVEKQWMHVFDEDGTLLGDLCADLFVGDNLVVEVKAVRKILPEHVAQILGYLRSSKRQHGLLINFGGPKYEIQKYIL